MPGSTVAASHARGVAFAFVPNVCNAKCQFCYVRPRYAESATLSRRALLTARSLATAMADLSFQEVRFTGGEPLMFSNFPEAVTPFIDLGLRYRVLTNGFDVDRHLGFLQRRPPSHVTLSVHSTTDASTFFGTPVDHPDLRRSRRDLVAITTVEATMVVHPARYDPSDLDRSIAELAEDGVAHLKVILENVPGIDGHLDRFSEITRAVEERWRDSFDTVRSSDPGLSRCRLPDKSFPSVLLDSGIAHACCVQVGTRPQTVRGVAQAPLTDVEGIRARLEAITEDARSTSLSTLPCGAFYDACPLALRQAS